MKDKTMKRIIAVAVASAALCGCSYNELPPKTDDITTTYVLPKGVKPTKAELDAVAAANAEYVASIQE